MVYATRLLEGSGRLGRLAALPFSSHWLQALPMLSPAAILVAGLYLTTNALTLALETTQRVLKQALSMASHPGRQA